LKYAEGIFSFILDDPKEFVFVNPKGISVGSMNFDNPKVYSDLIPPFRWSC